jgi:hypothetical protein
VTLMKVDPQTLATGYRSSKMVGSSVSNENNETVGTIDDLIITEGGQAPYAILSVGGFLGLGTKYVALHFTSLKIVDKKVVLPGAQRTLCRVFPTSNTIPTADVSSSARAATLMSLGRAGAASQLTYAPGFLGICFVLAVRPKPIFFAKTERVLA